MENTGKALLLLTFSHLIDKIIDKGNVYKAVFPALSIDKASTWPFNEAGDMRSRLL